MSEVKLPPLPEPGMFAEYWATQMQAYARAAIEANTPAVPDMTGGGLVAIKTLLSRDPCVHASTAIAMIDAMLAASPQPVVQPVQEEPVAWLHVCQKRPELRDLSFTWEWPERKAKGFKPKPLYTHPAPQPEPAENRFFNSIKSLVSGGSFDLTDSPKSLTSNLRRLCEEYEAANNSKKD